MNTEVCYIKHHIPFNFGQGTYIPDLSGNINLSEQPDYYCRRIGEWSTYYGKIPIEVLRNVAKSIKCGDTKVRILDLLRCGVSSLLISDYFNYTKKAFPAYYLASLIPHLWKLMEKATVGEQFRDERHFLSLDKNYWFSFFTTYQVTFDPLKEIYKVYEFHNMQRWANSPIYKDRDIYKPFAPLQVKTLYTIRYNLSINQVYGFYSRLVSDLAYYDEQLYVKLCTALAAYLIRERRKMIEQLSEISARTYHIDSRRVNPIYDYDYYEQGRKEKLNALNA